MFHARFAPYLAAAAFLFFLAAQLHIRGCSEGQQALGSLKPLVWSADNDSAESRAADVGGQGYICHGHSGPAQLEVDGTEKVEEGEIKVRKKAGFNKKKKEGVENWLFTGGVWRRMDKRGGGGRGGICVMVAGDACSEQWRTDSRDVGRNVNFRENKCVAKK